MLLEIADPPGVDLEGAIIVGAIRIATDRARLAAFRALDRDQGAHWDRIVARRLYDARRIVGRNNGRNGHVTSASRAVQVFVDYTLYKIARAPRADLIDVKRPAIFRRIATALISTYTDWGNALSKEATWPISSRRVACAVVPGQVAVHIVLELMQSMSLREHEIARPRRTHLVWGSAQPRAAIELPLYSWQSLH